VRGIELKKINNNKMFNINKIRDPITPTYLLRDQASNFVQQGQPINQITYVATITGSSFPVVFTDFDFNFNPAFYYFISSTLGDTLATNASQGFIPTAPALTAIDVNVNLAQGSTVLATVSFFYQGEGMPFGAPTLFDFQALFVYYSALNKKYYFGQFPLETTFTTTTNRTITGTTTIQLSSLYSNSYGSFGEVQRLYHLGYI
jgi:hypothetical protein